jgi:hypothetical protein
MNEVSITIPAQLYVDLYHIHGESSHKVIVECLRQLVGFENEEKNEALPNQAIPNDLPGWPTRYTKAHKVWKIATQFLADSGSIIPLNNHKDLVLDACVNEGINRNTATTTYSNWRQFYLQTLE